MDGQGRVSLEQFLAVVAMAEQDKGSRDAAFLHHLTHMKPSDSPVDNSDLKGKRSCIQACPVLYMYLALRSLAFL
eukprot:scaffold62332_cov20-Tisochrysis_lutea.AAC.3